MESVGRPRPRWAGYAAGAWSVVAVGVVLYWAVGGDAGSPPAGARAAAWVIAAFLGVGGIMAVSSVREVGRQMPRWWPLAGLWTACVPAGAGTFGFVMNALRLLFDGTVDDWPRFGVEALCAVGTALLAGTALAYQRTTAGICPRCGRAHAGRGRAGARCRAGSRSRLPGSAP